MYYALVSPYNIYNDSDYCIINVVKETFEVESPLFWVEHNENITTETHFYNVTTEQIEPILVEEEVIVNNLNG